LSRPAIVAAMPKFKLDLTRTPTTDLPQAIAGPA
jgi:hypothetical protein